MDNPLARLTKKNRKKINQSQPEFLKGKILKEIP